MGTVEQQLEQSGQTLRAYRLLLATLLLRPIGNLSLAFGARHFGRLLAIDPLVYFKALFDPYVAIGISMLVFALLTRMALLSVADLSFVLPVTAIGYILSALLGKIFLHEQVSAGHWLGTLLIFAGVVLVGSTPVRKSN